MHPLVKLLHESRLRGDGRLSLCRSETDHPCAGVCGPCLSIEKRAIAIEASSKKPKATVETTNGPESSVVPTRDP